MDVQGNGQSGIGLAPLGSAGAEGRQNLQIELERRPRRRETSNHCRKAMASKIVANIMVMCAVSRLA